MHLIQINQQKLLRRLIKNSYLLCNGTITKTFDELEKQYTFTQFVINLWNWLSQNISVLKSLRAFEKEMTFISVMRTTTVNLVKNHIILDRMQTFILWDINQFLFKILKVFFCLKRAFKKSVCVLHLIL